MFTNLLVSRGKSGIFMWGTMAQGIIVLLLLVFMAPLGINGMMTAYVIFNALWLFVWRYFTGKEISLTMGMFLRDTLPFALLATAVMLVTCWATMRIADIYTLLAVRIATAALLYTGALLAVRNKELAEAAHYLLKRKCK